MRTPIHVIVGSFLLAASASSAASAPSASGGETLDAGAAFAKLKSLAGEWQVTGPPELGSSAIVRYRVVSGGSVVLESLFPGSDHEMVTLYHMEGDDLVLTHYCVLGNQPRMVFRPGGAPNEIAFELDGGSNVDPGGPHMHSGRLSFLADGTIRGEWSYWDNGEKGGVQAVSLARQ